MRTLFHFLGDMVDETSLMADSRRYTFSQCVKSLKRPKYDMMHSIELNDHLRILIIRLMLEKLLRSGKNFGMREVNHCLKLIKNAGNLCNLTDAQKRQLLWASVRVDCLAKEIDINLGELEPEDAAE